MRNQLTNVVRYGIVLSVFLSTPILAQTPASNLPNIRFSREYYDSLMIVREQFYGSMAQNRLKELEDNTRKDTLKLIFLSGKYLSEIPEFLEECSNLQTLRLSGFDVYPTFLENLNHLTYLGINDSQITELPEFVFTLDSLESLNISGNTNLKKLSNRINNLKRLKYIKLSGFRKLLP